MLAGAIKPGRNNRAGDTLMSKTVDSKPPAVGPASNTSGIWPSKEETTCSARVGDKWDDRLALGAASGNPVACSNAWATGCDGTRSATVGPPAVTKAGTRGEVGTTSVK